jgi:hypothetical protein
MANVILFTDCTPRLQFFEGKSYVVEYTTYPAGAHSLASHLRQLGYSVVVIPHCLHLSLAGVKRIIQNNSQDLLWVGISTTLFNIKSATISAYRTEWHQSAEELIETTLFFDADQSWVSKVSELAWASNEVNAIAKFIKTTYDIPLLIGGAWISMIANGNLSGLESNIHLVTGNAELQVEEITKLLHANKHHELPFLSNNNEYDDHAFKKSKRVWTDHDLLSPTDWVPLEIARGCSFNCAYCNYDRKSTFDSYKNPKVIREHLIEMYEKYGVTKYLLVDDLYNDSKDKVRIYYDEVWSRLPFKPEWSSYMRLDMIWSDPESAEFIKNSGARIGTFGIETLSDIAGKQVGKGLGRSRIIETLEHLKETWGDEVLTHSLFIMGLPGESEASMQETIAWLRTTNLLHFWNTVPLWITPPAHKSFVLQLHNISKDNNKYGIEWIEENNWINSQGITFKHADALAKDCNENAPRVNVDFSDYPEFRRMGFSHQDIVKLRTQVNAHDLIYQRSFTLSDSIIAKIKTYLTLTD